MTTLFVRHQVQDYAAWRAQYDAFDATRTSMGVTGDSVYRAADEGNDVTVTHDFADLATARSFAGSQELHAVMAQAGVVGAPTIWFANQA